MAGGDTLPLIEERDEWGGSDALCDLTLPGDPALNLRPNTWTVPLSLETDNHWTFEENAKL